MTDQSDSASNTDNGLVAAYILNGKGGGHKVGWTEIDGWSPDQGTLWVHLDRSDPHVHGWLKQRSDMPPLAAEMLLAEETRPRSATFRDGLAVTLRGVNLNPGSDPEDMVSLRMWVQENAVVTMRARRLMAVQDAQTDIADGHGPRNAGDILITIGNKLVDRMGPVIDDMGDVVDGLEDELLTTESREIRSKLRDTRRLAIKLRRYLAPQRDALARLQQDAPSWLGDSHKLRLRETTDRVLRIVEELDEMRERAAVIQDELMSRISEQMNRTMYVLTVVASILMPLSFVTGLLGINVGGIPGAESKLGFLAVIVGLALFGILQVYIFKRLKWI